jgi:acyl homoserine lactone synthase
MLRYLYGHDLQRYPALADSMFRDRTAQFRDRLNWDVCVDEKGHERDQYDALDPLYVIWENEKGTHGGSMRFLPTTGRTMVAEHFAHLAEETHFSSPLIWECTRFCISQKADRRASAALVLGAGEIMDTFQLRHFIGVFDGTMARIYTRLGVTPDIIGSSGSGRNMVGVGLWEMQQEAWPTTLKRVGVSRETSRNWMQQSLQRAGD